MTLHESDCIFFPGSGCTLYVSFCQEVPLDFCRNDTRGPSSVCVTDETTGYVLADYTDDPFLQGESQF